MRSVMNEISITSHTKLRTMTSATLITTKATAIVALVILLLLPKSQSSEELREHRSNSIPQSDVDHLEFPLNLEFLEAEFFLFGALGYGLDRVAPNLTQGGPPPIGVRRANLDTSTRDIILQFGWQEVGHLRAILNKVKGFPRPLLDLSPLSFANVMDFALGRRLNPPFDPYVNSLNFLLATYLIPYIGLTGYVGTNSRLQGSASKKLVAGLLGVESGQDAVIRTMLYQRALTRVPPYGLTVAEFTTRISDLRDRLGSGGLKDEGLVVAPVQGAEGRVTSNVLVGDEHSLSYARSPEEILRILYGGGSEQVPGGFFPNGASGRIARSHFNVV